MGHFARKPDEKKAGRTRHSLLAAAAVTAALFLCFSNVSLYGIQVHAATVNAGSTSTTRAEAAKTETVSKSVSAAAASTTKTNLSKTENEKATAADRSASSDSIDAAVDFSYVERDISNWEAVYKPVLEANGTLATIGGLPARASENYDVAVAAEKLYALLTDTRKTSSILRTDKALILYDVLNGNYSCKAVELFLDHGYFTDYFQDLRKAGLVDDTYRLPGSFYETIVQGEVVTAPVSDEKSSGTQTYRMIRTDSDYLGTWQLLVVARSTRDKKTITSLEKKIGAFEENYVPKYRKP